MFKRSIETLATWFGLGLVPGSPGTFGTIGAIPVVYFFTQLGPLPYMIATLMFILFSILVAHSYEGIHGEHDASKIVIDEVAGFLVAMTWVPLTPMMWVAGFALFRFFDIVKPFPINVLDQRIKGGLGTVIDDVAAGLVVNVLLQFYLGRF